MNARFRRSRRGGVVVTFSADEAEFVRELVEQLREMLGGEEASEEEDPLAAAVGIGWSTKPPTDPALARLFPDGYRDDAEAAGEFRRYTEPELRGAKREAADTVLATLSEPAQHSQRRHLDEKQADAWLRVLTDLRLVLGTRLDLTEEWTEEYAALDPEDPRYSWYFTYDWLSYLQETLVRSL